VIHFLAVFVLAQLLMLLLLPLAGMLWRQSAGAERDRLLSSLMRGLSHLLEHLLSRLSGERRASLQSGYHRLKSIGGLYTEPEQGLLLELSKRFGLAFNLGALISCLYLISFSDLAFAWSTTLEIESGFFHRLLSILSAPWALFFPDAVPSEALIEGSRYFRSGNLGMKDPLLATTWWPFLISALILYGLLPRLLLWILARRKLRRQLQAVSLDHGDFQALFERLMLPLVELDSQRVQQQAVPPLLQLEQGAAMLQAAQSVSPKPRASGQERPTTSAPAPLLFKEQPQEAFKPQREATPQSAPPAELTETRPSAPPLMVNTFSDLGPRLRDEEAFNGVTIPDLKRDEILEMFISPEELGRQLTDSKKDKSLETEEPSPKEPEERLTLKLSSLKPEPEEPVEPAEEPLLKEPTERPTLRLSSPKPSEEEPSKEEPSKEEPSKPSPKESSETIRALPGVPNKFLEIIVVLWGDSPLEQESVQELLWRRLPWQIPKLLRAGVGDFQRDLESCKAVAQATEGTRRRVMLIVESFESPTLEVTRFLERLREHIGPRRSLIVGLLDESPEGSWISPDEAALNIWRHQLEKLEDPFLRLEPLIEGDR